jgi:oxaloacetate decarboxylase (Na+ extruding) subunit gamma
MQQTLWQQGVELMLFGMGTVFVFLALLIVMTAIMSSLIQRFVKPEPTLAVQSTGTPTSSTNDDQLIAVISAAIHKYRSRHK